MEFSYSYKGSSALTNSADSTAMSFAPDTRREPTYFRGKLGKALEFREAISALHDVVISDLRWHPKDRSAYMEWLASQDALDWAAIAADKRELAGQLKELNQELSTLRARSRSRMASFYAAQQRYFDYIYKRDYDAWLVLDPVITVHPDEIFFECFSKDESSYGRLSASYEVFGEVGEHACGTTNIDYSQALYDEFQKIRSYKNTSLEVDPSGFEVDTSYADSFREVKIDLPDSWVRGFLQVSSAMSLPARSFDLHPVDIHNICFVLRRNRELHGPRGMRFTLTPDRPIVITFEPWNLQVTCPRSIYKGTNADQIRIWGRRRIHILERLIPAARKFTVHLLGTGMPSFYVADLGHMSFTLGLSGWTANDWSTAGNFDLMAPRADVDDMTKRRVFNALKESWFESPAKLAARLELDQSLVLGALSAYTQAGQAIYDLDKQVYRVRELSREPLPMDRLRFSNSREESALAMLEAGVVKVVADALPDGAIRLEAIVEHHHRTYGPIVTLDRDERIVEARCSCNFYSQNKLFKGPCEHMLAARIAHARKLSVGKSAAGNEPGLLTTPPAAVGEDGGSGGNGSSADRPGFFRGIINRISPSSRRRSSVASQTQLIDLALNRAVDRLVELELVIIPARDKKALVEEMLGATFDARSVEHAIVRSFEALVESELTEEVYGDDDELQEEINKAFTAVLRAASEDDKPR